MGRSGRRPVKSRGSPCVCAGRLLELAPAYVFYASPESSYAIGQTLHVTGGVDSP
jgi:hypothetical protein